MKRAARLLLLTVLTAMTMTAITCKQIPAYLERVCKVYGRVTDAVTGLPLESVEVFVGTSLGTSEYSELTNGLGDYELELASGTWTLSFEKEGFGSWSIDVTVDERNNQRVEQNAFLTANPSPANPLIGTWAGTFTSTSGSSVSLEFEFKADHTYSQTIVDYTIDTAGTYIQDTAAKTVTLTVTYSSNPGFVPVGYTDTMTYSFSADNNTLTFTLGLQPGTGILTRQ